MPGGPLAGVRVLDLSAFGPGSRASRWLADMGAEIVKIGPPGADDPNLHFHAYGAGRGFRRIELDLKSAAGREAFLVLADRCDVIIESNRPGTAERLGVEFATVSRRNPRIIYCSITGFGQDSPHAAWVGHDLGYLGFGGYLHSSGREATGLPALPGATIADAAAGGMQAVMAITAALYERSRTHVGQYLDVSIVDGVLALMSLSVDEHLATGSDGGPRATLLTGKYACYDLYPTADDKALVVAAIEPKFWSNLCRLIGHPEFIDLQFADSRQAEIREALRSRFVSRPRDEWVERLGPQETCVAPVHAVDEVVSSAHVRQRGLIAKAHHPSAGSFEQLGSLLAGAPAVESPVEVQGSTTNVEDLLGEIGVSTEQIAELKEMGLPC